MARQNVYPHNEDLVYSANSTSRTKLPESGYITELNLKLKITVTTSSTTVLEDAAFRLIKSLRIKASGAKTYIDFSDGRQLKFHNMFQFRGKLVEDAIAGTASGGVYYYDIPIHLGLDPMNAFDPTVVIPAVRLQDLTLEVTWGDTSDIGASGVTALSATLSTLVNEIALSPGESEFSIWKHGILSPRYEPKIYSGLAVHSNLGKTDDLPVGDTWHRTVGLVFDSSDARTDTDVTSIGFKLPKQRETPIERPWYTQKFIDQRRHDLVSPQTGAFVVYGSTVSGRPVGFDLTKAVTGDAQLAFSIGTAGGSLHLLHILQQ